jgi:hypothetical protein
LRVLLEAFLDDLASENGMVGNINNYIHNGVIKNCKHLLQTPEKIDLKLNCPKAQRILEKRNENIGVKYGAISL